MDADGGWAGDAGGGRLLGARAGGSMVGLLRGVRAAGMGRAVERARVAKGAGQVGRAAAAATLYAAEHGGRLPQVWTQLGETTWAQNVYGFAGSAGTIDELGLDELHAGARPLNRYLGEFGAGDVVEPMRDPLDRGASNALPLVRAVRTGSMFTLVGTSYVLNTHAIDGVPCPYAPTLRTLTPDRDARMPRVASPARTWLIGDHAMYNYDGGADAGFRWRRSGKVVANVAFVDAHAAIDVDVAEGAVHTTEAYTFLPDPRWAAAR